MAMILRRLTLLFAAFGLAASLGAARPAEAATVATLTVTGTVYQGQDNDGSLTGTPNTSFVGRSASMTMTMILPPGYDYSDIFGSPDIATTVSITLGDVSASFLPGDFQGGIFRYFPGNASFAATVFARALAFIGDEVSAAAYVDVSSSAGFTETPLSGGGFRLTPNGPLGGEFGAGRAFVEEDESGDPTPFGGWFFDATVESLTVTVVPQAVPAPGAAALLAVGLVGLCLVRRGSRSRG
jgi:hypothetical protein